MAKSTITDDPVSEQDKFMLRLPHGMRGRIKSAADANGRSMNAEIVATLEAEYPPPRKVETLLDLEFVYFQWHSGDWKAIDEDSWVRFISGEAPSHVVDRMVKGRNYFVVAVFDKDVGLCNVIAHSYKIANGKVDASLDEYLSQSERDELAQIYRQASLTDVETERLRHLRQKMEPAFQLPADSVQRLKERLEKVATPEVVAKLLNRIS